MKESTEDALWTDAELSASLAAYFHMFKESREGKHTDRSHVIGELRRNALSRRSESSVRRRFNNISHVLQEDGAEWFDKYPPLENVGSHVKNRIRALIAGRPTEPALSSQAARKTQSSKKRTRYQLAYAAWPSLTAAAKAHTTLRYSQLCGDLQLPVAVAVRHALEPIQNLCMEKGWPPLTSIVISKDLSRPGKGFIAWEGNLAEAHTRVFEFPWENLPHPFQPGTINTAHLESRTPPENRNFSVPDTDVLCNGRGPYQDQFRDTLREIYGDRCALCDSRHPGALIAAHIVPWSKDVENRLNPRNGILLCRTHDAMYEEAIIEIADDYSVVIKLVDQSVLGHDLHYFLTNHTARTLRLPKKGLSPDLRFISWRRNQVPKKRR